MKFAIFGDIHGNLTDLQFFRKTLWPAGPEVTAGDFLFLGDFVDRGRDSIPVIAYIMSMKILNPTKWHMIVKPSTRTFRKCYFQLARSTFGSSSKNQMDQTSTIPPKFKIVAK
jgi:hypothetical protein